MMITDFELRYDPATNTWKIVYKTSGDSDTVTAAVVYPVQELFDELELEKQLRETKNRNIVLETEKRKSLEQRNNIAEKIHTPEELRKMMIQPRRETIQPRVPVSSELLRKRRLERYRNLGRQLLLRAI